MALDRDLRRRLAVGLLALALLSLAAYVVVSFLAVVVFAVFLYYAVRPIYRFLVRFGLPRRVRAGLAIVLFGVPFLVLIAYTVAIVAAEVASFVEATDVGFDQVDQVIDQLDLLGLELSELEQLAAGIGTQASLGVLLTSLAGVVSALSSLLVRLLLVVVATYYMLVDGPRFVAWFTRTYDESGVLREYVRVVDSELSLTLFGNIVNVFITAIVAILVFYAYNLLVPATVHVPFPALAGALAGVGSLIPVVGIKLVYVPITIGLAANAWLAGEPGLLVPVAILFAVSAVVVDFIPDFFIRAQVSGEETHTGLLMLSYIVGPTLFGFYGLFLVPIVLVLAINAVTILLPYALSGDPPAARQSRLEEFAGENGPRPPADRRTDRQVASPTEEEEE